MRAAVSALTRATSSLREVAGAAHALLLQLVEGGGEDLRAAPKHFMPSMPFAFACAPMRAPARAWRSARRCPGRATRREDARRDDALPALRALRWRRSRCRCRSRVADAGDAVAEPQLVHVLGRRALLVAADVAVHVDEAGQQVLAAEVDLAAARGQLRRALSAMAVPGRAQRTISAMRLPRITTSAGP
jgi:hypothetical protein